MELFRFTVNAFEENTYLLVDQDSGEGILIDPGMSTPAEEEEVFGFIDENQVRLTQVVNTHCHIDHVLGNWAATTRYNVPLLIPAGELPYLRAVKSYAPNYGFATYQEKEPDGFLGPQDKLKLGNHVFTLLSVPGHSADHLAFYSTAAQLLIAGDVLFRESVGRTDLPGGNTATLMASIRNTLYKLPPDTTVWPGHGPQTTIGHEMAFNPFCRPLS